MAVLVDDSSPFGTYAPGRLRRQLHASTKRIYKAGWLGRRVFGRLRSLDRLFSSRSGGIVDVERFGLRWRLYVRGNVADSRLLLRPDSFEPVEIASILALVNPGFVFVDVGANCGFYALRIAQAAANSGNGQIIAIEPHPAMRQRLEFNVRMNCARGVNVLGCGVGDRNGTAKLFEGTKNLGTSRISGEGSIEVELRTLLDIATVQNLERIDAVKVDVEGFEDRVLDPFLRNAPEYLLPRMIVAEYSWSGTWECDWMGRATARGYREHARTRQSNVILVRQ